MLTVFAACFCCAGQRMRSLLLLALLLAACPAASLAAGLAEDQTVVYYLIEMQRRVTKTCNGNPVPGAPSLLPSEALARLAGDIHPSGTNLESLLTANGLDGVPVFHAFSHVKAPSQVLDDLKARHCSSLMGEEYRYVGAAYHLGVWSVLLSAQQPSTVPMERPAAGAGGAPVLPDDETVPVEEGAGEDFAASDPGPAVAAAGVYQPPVAPGAYPAPAAARPAPAPRPGVTPLQAEIQPQPLVVGAAGGTGVAGAQGAQPAGAAGAPAPAGPQSGDPSAPFVPAVPRQGASLAESLFDLVNQARSRGYQCGRTAMPAVPPLRLNPRLSAVAARHARDMSIRGYFSSTSPDGVQLGARLTDAGYLWSGAAENIVQISPPASSAVQNWLANEGQCKNLMSPAYTEAGAGFDEASRYWVFTMARPVQLSDYPDEVPSEPQRLPDGKPVTAP